MDKKLLKKISYVLDWYEGTDGCEREEAANEMYNLLSYIEERLKKELK